MRWNPATQLLRKLLTDTSSDDNEHTVVRASLTLRFRRWPRDWQKGAAWCANRVDGGPLRECGTHYLAAVREVFGPGAVARVRATVVYPDGAAGVLAESRVDGELELRNGLIVRVTVSVDVDDNDGAARASAAAAGAGGDCYELELETKSGTVWQLYDFVKLRQRKINTQALESDEQHDTVQWKDLIDAGKEGGYGRTESVTTLCDRVRGIDVGTKSTIVTAQDGREVQRMLDGLLVSNGEWVSV